MLDIYKDLALTDKITSTAQSKLVASTQPEDTFILIRPSAGFSVGDTIRIGSAQRLIQSIETQPLDISKLLLSGGTLNEAFEIGTLVNNAGILNGDYVSGSSTDGYTDERALYVGNKETNKKYLNISVTSINSPSDIKVKYALDNNGIPGEYLDTLAIGVVPTAAALQYVKIWRKVTVNKGVSTDSYLSMKHKLVASERINYV